MRDLVDYAHKEGSRVFVTLIPSKELVMHKYATRQGLAYDFLSGTAFTRAVKNQKELEERLVTFFKRSGIPYASALETLIPVLGELSADNKRLYKLDDDHTFERGYQVYADTAAGLISRVK